jgi:hypothetical protein
VIYLLMALAIIVVGVTIVLLRHRDPTGVHHGIDHFSRRREALAPRERHSRFRHHRDH